MSTPSGELQPIAERRVSTTLFLADNNAADLHDIAQALTAAGHIVIKLTDGQQLLALLDRLVPDAILLASGLPYHDPSRAPGKVPVPTLSNHKTDRSVINGGAINGDNGQLPQPLDTYDGFALCRLLAATTEWVDIPTILLTPIADPELRMRGIEMKAWDVVAKPCHPPELSVRINSLINRAHLQRERSEELQRTQATLRQQAGDLQQIHAQQRQSEQKSDLLLSTAQAHSRQLYLLLTLALQNISVTQPLPRQRQQQLQQQMSAIQTFLNELVTLVAALSAYQQEMQPRLPQSNELSSPQPPFDSGSQFPSPGSTPWQTVNEPQIPQRRAARDRCGTEETSQLPFLPTVGKRRIPQLNQLSDREYEILVRLANGEGYEEIARLLEISTSTVRSYRSRIMHKLGITTTTEMIKFAVRHRIIDLS